MTGWLKSGSLFCTINCIYFCGACYGFTLGGVQLIILIYHWYRNKIWEAKVSVELVLSRVFSFTLLSLALKIERWS